MNVGFYFESLCLSLVAAENVAALSSQAGDKREKRMWKRKERKGGKAREKEERKGKDRIKS